MADEVANVAFTKVVPTATTLKPYYDDFEESKNFHRMVFKPGYAVQARELTQMQTIMQNQIERFGSHVFNNGSIVHGGQITMSETPYINLQSQYLSTDIDVDNFIGKIVNDASGNTNYEASVIAGQNKVGNTNPVIMIAYRSGSEFTASQTIKVLDENVFAETVVDSAALTGIGTIASINDGVFFFNGYFVKKPKETIIVDPFTRFANAKIGLQFTEAIINENDDTSLLDPAQEASNYQAPGADRLKVQLSLVTRPLDTEDEENFIELMRIENGVKVKQTVYPVYSVLGETFARRTFDESGNYTVRPFRIRIGEHPSDDTKIRLYVSPGKAYVRGYEVESISEQIVDIDRSRDTQTLNNIDIRANYGNDTIIKDLRGIINLNDMPMIHLHCVPYGSIDITNATTYDQTRIGTARVRSLEYYGASNAANAQTHTYDMSMFDLKFRNITTNVNTSTANTVTLYNAAGKLTAANNAYAGGTLRFTSGSANGSSYLITGYNGVTNTFELNKDITSTSVNNTSNVSIDGSFAIVESVYSSVAFTPSASNEMRANIDDANRNSSGYTYLFDQKLNSLVFKAPYKYIEPGSITDQQYTYSKVFASAIFAGGTCTISVNPSREAFNGVDGSGSSTSVLDNFIVVRTDTNEVVRLDSVSINATTGVATLLYGSYTGSAIVTAKVNLNNGPNVNQKAKALNVANTTNFATTSITGTFVSTQLGSTIDVYLDSSQAVITNPSKISGAKQYLHVSDVRRITKVYDAQGCTLTSGADISGCTDVTDRFTFNNGQKESHYDYAWIELKPRKSVPIGPLVVCFDWYDHVSAEGDDKGYFSVDSYPNVTTTSGYGDIPKFIDTSGIVYDLRDCIDFRPRRKNCEALPALSGAYELEGVRIPIQASNFGCDLAYYLARADLMVVSKDSFPPFLVQKGISGTSPIYPKSIEGTMPIYKINLNPYTVTKDDVQVTYIENKRYTMRDIGLLEQRIQNLEYYTSLSILEKTATDMIIKDPNGLDRTKNGILVDNFFTHGIGDVWSPDYWISMDKVFGAAAPPVNSAVTKMFVAEDIDTFTGRTLTTLDFEEVPAIIQPYATKCVSIQPYQTAKYIGIMVMDPPADFWVDQSRAPDLVININGENDNNILGPPTGCAPDQTEQACIRAMRDLTEFLNSLGIGAVVDDANDIRAFGLTLSLTDRMFLANTVNTILCPETDIGVWNTGRNSILSSWFGTTTR